MTRPITILLLLCALLPAAYAQYADLTFTIDDGGVVTIDGTTNIPTLTPGQYTNFTSKDGAHWLFNVTTPQAVDTYVYAVTVPAGAQVNYIAGKNARITTDGDSVVVRGSGENTSLAIAVQYTLTAVDEKKTSFPTWFPIAGMIALVLLVFIVARGARIKKKRMDAELTKIHKTHPEHATHATPSYLDGIPERQRLIVKLLRNANGTLTQRQIELVTKLPKSSVSRNVEALRLRGIIEKGQHGMTNTVVLAEKYR